MCVKSDRLLYIGCDANKANAMSFGADGKPGVNRGTVVGKKRGPPGDVELPPFSKDPEGLAGEKAENGVDGKQKAEDEWAAKKDEWRKSGTPHGGILELIDARDKSKEAKDKIEKGWDYVERYRRMEFPAVADDMEKLLKEWETVTEAGTRATKEDEWAAKKEAWRKSYTTEGGILKLIDAHGISDNALRKVESGWDTVKRYHDRGNHPAANDLKKLLNEWEAVTDKGLRATTGDTWQMSHGGKRGKVLDVAC